MFYPKIHEQTMLEISQGDHIGVTAESFLIDRQARELSRHTLKFYREFLRTFMEYCSANSLTLIQQITPDFLRRYFLAFGEKHIITIRSALNEVGVGCPAQGAAGGVEA